MTPEEAYNKAFNLGQRLQELEPIIQQDARYAYYYARDVLADRWPEAEPIIQQDAELACLYAKNVIKGRWSEAESVIAQDAGWAHLYAKYVIKDRWLEAEETIKQSDYESHYLSNFFSEPVVVKDQYSDYEWGKAGAIGCFAPRRLFDKKESLLDAIID